MNISTELKDWLNVVKLLNTKQTEIVLCPSCGQGSIHRVYIGAADTRIGYLQAWCDTCQKGIYISRVRIPEQVELVAFDEKEKIAALHIPEIKQILP